MEEFSGSFDAMVGVMFPYMLIASMENSMVPTGRRLGNRACRSLMSDSAFLM